MDTKLTNVISLDWFAFTVARTAENEDSIISLFGDYGYDLNDYGGMGYDRSANILEGGRVYWHSSNNEMGMHVRLNAQSLSLVGMTPLGLINRVLGWGAKFTRIDIAFDDFDGLLDIDEMYRKTLAGELVTRWTKVTRVNGSNMTTGQKTGDTVSIGSRASEAYLRIYDKLLEREAKGVNIPDIDSWVRVELELKSDKAQVVAEMLGGTALNGGPTAGELCASLLYGLLDFKYPDKENDTNKSRWVTAEWWSEFVHASSKLMLSIPKKHKTLESSKEWIRKAVSSTLGMIVLSKPDDNGETGESFINGCVWKGKYNMSQAQKKRLEIYNEQQEAKMNTNELVNK